MHAKFATFSNTNRRDGTPASNVTWVSSANLDGRTGDSEFNSAIVYYGSTQMYNGLTKVFQDMLKNPPVARESSPGASDADYYDPGTGRGYFEATDASTSAYVSPEQDTDIWERRLRLIGRPSDGGHACTVRVMQAYIYDMDAVNELVYLRKGGCDVKVVVHRTDPDNGGTPNLSTDALRAFCLAGMPMHETYRVHDKFVISSSDYSALDNIQEIMHGSTNMTIPAVHYDDELLTRIAGAPTIYNSFLTHWTEAYNHGVTVPC